MFSASGCTVWPSGCGRGYVDLSITLVLRGRSPVGMLFLLLYVLSVQQR